MAHDLLRAFLVAVGIAAIWIGLFAPDTTKKWATALIII